MSLLARNPAFRRIAAVLVTVLGLGAMTALAAKPADARVFFRIGVGVPAVWGWGWGYYPGYWYRPYYPAYWGWQWRRWCYWHPYRCY
jgi:hypothetical protein